MDNLLPILRNVTRSHSAFLFLIRQLFCIAIVRRQIVEASEIAIGQETNVSVCRLFFYLRKSSIVWHMTVYLVSFLLAASGECLYMLRICNKTRVESKRLSCLLLAPCSLVRWFRKHVRRPAYMGHSMPCVPAMALGHCRFC